MKNAKIARAVRTVLVAAGAASAGLYGPPLAAQQQTLEEIVVTGTRIAKRDAIAESPIYTVDQEAIKVSGSVTVEHYLNTLPQIVPSVSSQSNNPSSGGRAFVDLRGLGSNRNLVLVDGRRPMGQHNGGTSVDVNTIPTALIERVEVISGGAAAVYGPDAIAGVVNFIMKKSFDGLAVDGQYRLTERGDGEEWTTDITLGSDFAEGRGGAVFNASYFKRQQAYKDGRPWAAQAVSPTGIFPNGSWSPGANAPSQAAVDALFGGDLCNTNGGQRGFGFNPDGTPFCTGVDGNPNRNVVNYQGPQEHIARNFYPDSFSYNFEPDNLMVLPMERWNLYKAMDLEINPHFNPYVRATFTNYNATRELAPTPASGFLVPTTNPFIPAEIAQLAASRDNPDAPLSINKRFNALGGRTEQNSHDVWQLTAGSRGEITSAWSYDLYGSWGRSVRNERQGGNVRVPEVNELLNAPDGGASICEGGLNFFGLAALSQACQDYISLEAKNLTTVEQGIMEGAITGDLLELPAGTVQSAFGASYRHLDFDFRPDSGLQPGIVQGFNEQLPVSGRLWYTDLFAEVSIPLVTNAPFVQNLSTTLGLRSTDNNAFGRNETWKATFDWTMVDALRARGGVQRAIRSPNIQELYAPQLNNFPNYSGEDPCNFNSPFRTGPNAAAVQALCAQQAAVAGGPNFQQPFGQAIAISGGNPDLKPEQADTWSVGLVATPQFDSPFAQRVAFSIDYFQIDMDDVIAAVGAVSTIHRCFNADNANPTFDINNEWCQLYARDQADGRVIDLLQLSRNQSSWTIKGVDMTANLGMDVGPGSLDFAALVTYLDSFTTRVTAVDPRNEWRGTISQVTAESFPKWRGTLQSTYTMGDWQVNLQARYIDSMTHAARVTNPESSATGTPSTWFTDLTGRWDLTETLTLRAGVNNLANQKPRLYSPNVQAGTDPSLFDVLGRRYFVGFNMRM